MIKKNFSQNGNPAIYLLFLWDWCSMCGAHIKCPKCGNNTCNAGFGTLPDGTCCDVCNLAYQYAHDHYRAGTAPKRKAQVATFNKRIRKNDA